jgi:outer membrane protein assembly factor BamD
MQAFEDRDCLTAQPLFQNIRREYPYSRYAALAELRHADCEMEQQHYTEAIRAYRSFIRQRPTHAEVDTANFSVARAYFRQIPTDFLLSPPPEERDQAATRSALRVVRRFLLEFPESDHVEEAQDIERQVLALLARHELYVANYYLQQDHPEATIARVRTLLDQYEGSGIEAEAMIVLGRTYLHMRDSAQARLTFGEIIDRYPESGYAAQARSFLATMGIDEPVVDTGEPPAPEPGGGIGGGPRPDIDDVTGSESTSEGAAIDRAEDASEAGIVVDSEGDVEAGSTERGETGEGEPDPGEDGEGDEGPQLRMPQRGQRTPRLQ